MSGVDPSFEGSRLDYDLGSLDVDDVAADPLSQLRRWVDDAVAAGALEPTAMSLGTIAADGSPRSRTVLMRALEDDGVICYTNTESDKARELAADPRCTAHFLWNELHRQVRIVGRAEPVDPTTADAYFASRPRGSQIGAWASPQSRVIASRAELEDAVAAVESRFAEQDEVPRPPHWSGYLIRPQTVEFWQGRPSRLHDRLRYRRATDVAPEVGPRSGWSVERLAP